VRQGPRPVRLLKLYRGLAGDKAFVVASSTIALYMERLYRYEIDPWRTASYWL